MERIWIYQAEKNLESNELNIATEFLRKFTQNWSSHGEGLKARFEIRYNRFIIIMVDENKKNASGCSIDSSVNALKELGNILNQNLLRKDELAFLTEKNEIITIPFNKIKENINIGTITEDLLFFDNNINQSSDLENNWLKKAKNSWLLRFFK